MIDQGFNKKIAIIIVHSFNLIPFKYKFNSRKILYFVLLYKLIFDSVNLIYLQLYLGSYSRFFFQIAC